MSTLGQLRRFAPQKRASHCRVISNGGFIRLSRPSPPARIDPERAVDGRNAVEIQREIAAGGLVLLAYQTGKRHARIVLVWAAPTRRDRLDRNGRPANSGVNYSGQPGNFARKI